MPLADLFDISESDTVWDAWLSTVTLLDMLENIQQISQYYNFQQAHNKIAKIYMLAESHSIDKKNMKCLCGLSDGEHALLKRKMMRFFKLQVTNLKHFIY
ncbi:MAG: hypothetical protein M3M91_08040 [Thermoproteota archaeon]|nr:hypothetical protein [Thermoproteota archaeon]